MRRVAGTLLALATLAGRWRLRPHPGVEVRPGAGLALRPPAARVGGGGRDARRP